MFSFLLVKYLGVEWLDLKGRSVLNFLRNRQMVFILIVNRDTIRVIEHCLRRVV